MRPITAEEEFCKNTELKRENLEHLRQWMSAQPHLPRGVTGNQGIPYYPPGHTATNYTTVI
jgi:hypothetical protein